MSNGLSSIVAPVNSDARTSFHSAVRLAFFFAAIKLSLHIATNLWQAHIGWGYFGDEMYYILCGRHLAWGYVDHGPIVALQAKLALALFGKSLVGIRMLSSIAAAAKLFLTGMLAHSLGGRRPAQTLAMIGVLIATQYLATDSYLSMNSFEAAFWMGCIFLVITMVQGGSEQLWLLFGLCAGVGLLNKPSMAFFLTALLLGIVLTPQRKVLQSRWAAAGFALLILIVLPNVIWQMQNQWPTLEFLHRARLEANSLGRRNPFIFVALQCLNLSFLTLPIWGAGLGWLFFAQKAKRFRWIALTYIIFLVLMMSLRAKVYYVTPVYPVLFAAGGIFWERYFAHRRRVVEDRAFAFQWIQGTMLLLAALALPLSIPILRPATWIDYAKTVHAYEIMTRGVPEILPEFYADRFGWQEETDEVTRIYRSLSPQDQERVGIFCQDYGQASGINFLGSGLPFATSGHNNYYLWGPHGETGDVMILLTSSSLEKLQRDYASVEVAGRVDNPYSMPFQKINIYLARGRRKSLLTHWAEVKHY